MAEPYQKNKDWNPDEIEKSLRAAMDVLTPDIYDKLDLTLAQEVAEHRAGGPAGKESGGIIRISRKVRTAAAAMAACLAIMIGAGGLHVYRDSRVESVIGLDVNPSIELSVNRNERVLEAKPLNGDAVVILDDMDLKNVKVNIAVNALIGSMVRHGYLDELENAILVTVTNTDSEKAAVIRQDVVAEIESSLEEHRLSAVVYDQEAAETDELRELSEKYGISYGKACFLSELIRDNEDLTEEDMEEFAGMSMEEIAAKIGESSYVVASGSTSSGEMHVTTEAPTTAAEIKTTEAETAPESTAEESTAEESTGESAGAESEGAEAGETAAALTEAPETEAPETMAPATEAETAAKVNVKIDNVDYADGVIYVMFKDKVSWKDPSVSVEDEDGESYSARIIDTASDGCEIEVAGMDGGVTGRFRIGGVGGRGGSGYGFVSGTFETPEIAEGAYSADYRDGGKHADDEGADEDDEDDFTRGLAGQEADPAESSGSPENGDEEPASSAEETGTETIAEAGTEAEAAAEAGTEAEAAAEADNGASPDEGVRGDETSGEAGSAPADASAEEQQISEAGKEGAEAAQ